MIYGPGQDTLESFKRNEHQKVKVDTFYTPAVIKGNTDFDTIEREDRVGNLVGAKAFKSLTTEINIFTWIDENGKQQRGYLMTGIDAGEMGEEGWRGSLYRQYH